jgi:predicted MFS family arabinose efflux permease
VVPPLDDPPGSGSRRDPLLLALAFGGTFASRAVAGAVVEGLRAELWLTDQALGTLVAVFAAAFAVALLASARLSARLAARPLLGAGAALCGAGTAAGAWAGGFWALVAARLVAGAGAGLAAGVAAGLLAAGPAPRRPLRLRLLTIACAGLALGLAAGGLPGAWPAWREAFVATGGALLVLGLLCGLAGATAGPAAAPQAAPSRGWLALPVRRLAAPSGWLAALGALLGTAGASALVFWLPAFLERTRGVPRTIAGLELGGAVLVAGLSSRALAPPAPGAGAPRWTAAGGAVAAGLATAGALWHSSPLVYLPCLLLAFLATLLSARAALAWLASAPGAPATPVALALLAGVGEPPGAFGVGALADRIGFGRALLALPAALLAAGLLLATAAWVRGRERREGEHAGRRAA